MYTTCVIWIAFVPIYFGSDSKVWRSSERIPSSKKNLLFLVSVAGHHDVHVRDIKRHGHSRLPFLSEALYYFITAGT